MPTYRDGQPCRHPGCIAHMTHPCEGCGRRGARGIAVVPDEPGPLESAVYEAMPEYRPPRVVVNEISTQAEAANEGVIILVKLGNDVFPWIDREGSEDMVQGICSQIRRATNAPIIVCNHTVSIEAIRVPSQGVTPTGTPGPVVNMISPRASRDINI